MPHGTGYHRGGGGEEEEEEEQRSRVRFASREDRVYHHHHHDIGHDYHHYHDSRPPLGWNGYSYSNGGGPFIFRKPKSILWMLFLFALLSLLILSLESSPNTQDSYYHGNTYSSRDTALQTHSSRFCESFSVQGAGHSAEKVGLTLYLLKSETKATKEELIEFSKTTSMDRNYKYWMFHLLPNSKIKLSACVESGSDAVFYLVQGVQSFERWQEDGEDNYVERVKVSSKCSGNSDSQHQFYDYKVPSDSRYYLVYESRRKPSTLQLSFSITQVLYTVSKDNIAQQCSVSLNSIDSCHLPVSFWSSSSITLLKVEPQLGAAIDWEANNEVEVTCDARLWLYIVLCLTVPLGISLLSIAIACTCFMSWWNRLKALKKMAASDYAEANGTSVKPSAPVPDDRAQCKSSNHYEERPPPYNYHHPPQYRP